MISETHLRLINERISTNPSYLHTEKSKTYITIDAKKQIALQNIQVWEIDNGTNKIYKISVPGLSQTNYNDRVMIRGKQSESHVISQYRQNNVTINMYPIVDCMSSEEQERYLQALASNNIRGCIEQLKEIETILNQSQICEKKEPVRVLVKLKKERK